MRERRWEIPEANTNRRILATPREPLNDISEIARGNIPPVDLASWVSQRATTSHVTIWVRKIGARGDIPLTLIASKRLFTFFFLRTNQLASSTMESFTARKLSSIDFLVTFLLDNLDRSKGDVSHFHQHYGFSLLFSSCGTNSLCLCHDPFPLWDSLKKRFEELGTRYFVIDGKGKVEKSWCSKNVDRVDPKEWWNVSDYTMRLRERKRLSRKKTVCQFQFQCNPLRTCYLKEDGYNGYIVILL